MSCWPLRENRQNWEYVQSISLEITTEDGAQDTKQNCAGDILHVLSCHAVNDFHWLDVHFQHIPHGFSRKTQSTEACCVNIELHRGRRSSTRSTFGVWKWFFFISVGSDVVAQLSEIGPIGLYCAMQEIGNALVGIRSGVFSLIELGVITYWLNCVLVELGQMITLIVTQIDWKEIYLKFGLSGWLANWLVTDWSD